jgi:hypothetical protein
MLISLEEMIKEEISNLSIDDISLALYHHIMNGKIKKAKEIVEVSFEKF